MKKTLVTLLALVFVLGIAGTAFAAPANPFVDVPAKHWAYGAVAKLAKAGIVDGYGDGTFRGDKQMTRYEMAQVVAKAMAKSEKADAEMKALIDKLAVEFAAELNNLGVRVAKLEAKTNVGLSFESRLRFFSDDNKASDKQGNQAFDLRQRIYLSGVVNDKIDYGARIQSGNPTYGSADSGIVLNRMFFTIKDFAGVDKLTLGKFPTLFITNGLLNGSTNGREGLKIESKLGEQATFQGFIANVGASSEYGLVNFDIKASKDMTFNVGYAKYNIKSSAGWPGAAPGAASAAAAANFAIGNSLDFGARAKMGDFWLKGEYVNTKDKATVGVTTTRKAYAFALSNSSTGFFSSVTNMVDPMKAHTDAFEIGYKSIDPNAVPMMSSFNGQLAGAANVKDAASYTLAQDNNIKGFFFEYQNVLSKGLVFSFDYVDLKSKTAGSNDKDKLYQARLEFYF